MTIGVGGSSNEVELNKLKSMRGDIRPVDAAERQARIEYARRMMKEQGISALYLDVSTSLTYFTVLKLHRSERLHGAIIPDEGDLIYICPAFEKEKLEASITLEGKLETWEEHEDPTALVINTIKAAGYPPGTVAIDEMTPFFIFDGFRRAGNSFDFINAETITKSCRMRKSDVELANMQRAKDITLEVLKATARILKEGITTTEVEQFIADAHIKAGANEGPLSFCIVLFGEATAYPHGVPYPQTLKQGDMVLIDTGAKINDYTSDITRSFVFGDPTDRQRFVWDTEKAAQAAAFDAAQIGVPCGDVDAAARKVIEEAGFGPGYAVPGLPHRTGHGIGLDIHEGPYLVNGDTTPLQSGMCFSNEPMICIYGEFGVRLEDHFFMTDDGPRWFTAPAHSVDDPFGYAAC